MYIYTHIYTFILHIFGEIDGEGGEGSKYQRSMSIPASPGTPATPVTPGTPAQKDNVWRSVFNPGSNLATRSIGAHVFDKPEPNSPTVYDWYVVYTRPSFYLLVCFPSN